MVINRREEKSALLWSLCYICCANRSKKQWTVILIMKWRDRKYISLFKDELQHNSIQAAVENKMLLLFLWHVIHVMGRERRPHNKERTKFLELFCMQQQDKIQCLKPWFMKRSPCVHSAYGNDNSLWAFYYLLIGNQAWKFPALLKSL